jgi:hypothetical protein
MPRSRNRFKLSEVARLLKSAKLAGATNAHVTLGDEGVTVHVDLNANTTPANGEACTPVDKNEWDEELSDGAHQTKVR